MSANAFSITFWLLSVIAAAGALTVVLTRDVMRLIMGLGAFLLAVAGFFLLYGAGFLAVAQVFVYVGGVLVLMLFALMLLHRSEAGVPDLGNRHDLGAVMVAAGLFALLVLTLQEAAPTEALVPGAGVEMVGETLLGTLLPHFELAGAILLAALVAVVGIMGGERS